MKKRNSLVALIVIMSFVLSGCVAFMAGGMVAGAGVVWLKGKLYDTVSKPLPVVHMAVRAGLKDLRIEPFEDRGDNLSATVKAKLGSGDGLWIKLSSEGSNTTRMMIRVGYWGDEKYSRRILEAIRKHY